MRNATPGPDTYHAKFELVETDHKVSFTHGGHGGLHPSGSGNGQLGPGQYDIRSRFDDIAQTQKRRRDIRLRLEKKMLFKPHRRKTMAEQERSGTSLLNIEPM